jgi:hypothetical protein
LNGKLLLDQQKMAAAFGRQITAMVLDFGGASLTFSEARYDASGKKVSTVSWTPCQFNNGCGSRGAAFSCCEVFEDKTKQPRVCGLYGSDSAFLFDRYLSYFKDGVGLVAGIGLLYNSSGTKVTAAEFGLPPLPSMSVNEPRELCFLLDVMCDPMTRYFQVPKIDAVYVGDNICLRARVESQHGCVASTGKYLEQTSWKVLFMLLAPFAMVSGLLVSFMGWRLFRVTALVLGLFFGLSVAGVVIVFSVFLACEANKPTWANVDFWTWSHECTFHYLTTNV